MNEPQVLFHGTNAVHSMIEAGSWVTDDLEAAAAFAASKIEDEGGHVCIATIEVDEMDVDWDVLSAMAGVGDARGTLLRPASVREWIFPGRDVLPAPGNSSPVCP